MVSVLISLTSKTWPLLYGGVLFFSFSCASSLSLKDQETQKKLSQKSESDHKKNQHINYGPSSNQDTSFIDKTSDYNLSGLSAVSIHAVDLNLDGRSDLVILPHYLSRPKFLIFDSTQKKFIPWANDPLPKDFKASFLYFYDLNNDKVMDLVSGVLNQKTELNQVPIKIFYGQLANGLLSFNEVPQALAMNAAPTSSVTLIDYDLDGFLDLFIGNWFENKNGEHFPVADKLFKNNNGKFEDVSFLLTDEGKKLSSEIYPPEAKPTYGSSSCDIDQNGFPDILTVSSAGFRNKLWMNLANSQSGERFFEDMGSGSQYGSDPNGSLVATGGGRSFFSACADYNNDGIMDIFMGELSHAYDNESVDKSSILTGAKKTYPPYFIRTEYVSNALSEAWNQGDRRANWFDYNLDGRIDLLVDNSGFPPHSRLVMFEQSEEKDFVDVASKLGIDIVNPAATIMMDLNQDGLVDIITAQNNIRRADISPRLYVFENNLKVPGRKSIKIHLGGIKSNTHGLGAMVILTTKKGKDKIVQRRWNELSQGGLASQNESFIHFGVDSGVEIKSLKVRWPYLVKVGHRQGRVLEKQYSLKSYANKNNIEISLCEDGRIFTGKVSCQF